MTGLLLARDRSSLSRQENASVETLIGSGAVLTLLSVTDFVAQAPLGVERLWGGGGAYALNASPSSRREARLAMSDLVLILVLAAVGAFPLAAALGIAGIEEKFRFGVVVFVGLSGSGRGVGCTPAHGLTAGLAFALALAGANLSTLRAFLEDLAEEQHCSPDCVWSKAPPWPTTTRPGWRPRCHGGRCGPSR